MKTFFFFFLESTCALCPWSRAFLSLASRVSVLGKAVLGLGLGLGFFLCPWRWPWPRALCPRLHLWSLALASSIPVLGSRVSVLGKAVLGLGLGFFLCPWRWPWPRALCPRLHLWEKMRDSSIFHLYLSRRRKRL